MLTFASDLDRIPREIGATLDRIDFNGRGPRTTFGNDLADMFASIIVYRTLVDQVDPEGNPLAPLAEATLFRKAALGFPETVGYETGLMLSVEEVKGDVQIDYNGMHMTYGKTDKAKQEAEWFENPTRGNQPPRKFYGIGDRPEDLQRIDELIEECLSLQFEDLWGAIFLIDVHLFILDGYWV